MAKRPANANADVAFVDGPSYPVRLAWLPREGDLIDLYSFVDKTMGKKPTHRAEVVQVVHYLHDVSDKTNDQQERHFVTVHVKSS
mgnify:FL=1|jgi:hypothetical protein